MIAVCICYTLGSSFYEFQEVSFLEWLHVSKMTAFFQYMKRYAETIHISITQFHRKKHVWYVDSRQDSWLFMASPTKNLILSTLIHQENILFIKSDAKLNFQLKNLG